MDKTNQGFETKNSEEISLKDVVLKIQEWWRFILSKWLLILIGGMLGGVIGLTYAWFKKPFYIAELSFALQDDRSGGMSGAMGLASQFGIDIGGASAGGEFSGDNLLGLMKSRSMIEKTLLTPVIVKNKKETLAEFYIDFNKLREGWEKNPELKDLHFMPDADPSKFTLKQDSILGVFHKNLINSNLTVDKADKKLSIISLKVVSSNELFSKYFTEVLAKVVSDFYVQTKTKKEVQNVAILQRQTDSVRMALNGAIAGVASSMDAAPNPNPTIQTLHVSSQRKQVDVQANTTILGELVRNLEMAKMSLLQETPLIQVIDRPILPLQKEKLGKLKGLISGGLIGALIMMLFFILNKSYKNIMSDSLQ